MNERCVFWDDVRGGYLDCTGVEKAREEELAWLRCRDLFEVVGVEQRYARVGKMPIALNRVGTNKATTRSR